MHRSRLLTSKNKTFYLCRKSELQRRYCFEVIEPSMQCSSALVGQFPINSSIKLNTRAIKFPTYLA